MGVILGNFHDLRIFMMKIKDYKKETLNSN